MRALGAIWCRRCGTRERRRTTNSWIGFLERRRRDRYDILLCHFCACFFFFCERLGLTSHGCKAEQTITKILDKLTPDNAMDRNKQNELAVALYNSSPPLKLLASIEKYISNPNPVLALSLTRAYKKSGKKEAAIRFAESYLSRFNNSGYKSLDLRQFLVFKITFARYQGMISFGSGINIFQEIIAEFTHYLGETHICTLQARFECAQLWFRDQRSVKTSLI